jgi:hypothetical protein
MIQLSHDVILFYGCMLRRISTPVRQYPEYEYGMPPAQEQAYRTGALASSIRCLPHCLFQAGAPQYLTAGNR